MNKPKAFRTEVRTDSDYTDIPAAVEFSIDEATARDIIQLSQLVKTNDLYKVEKFDYRATYLKHDPDDNSQDTEEPDEENNIRTDANILNVSDNEFWFSAYIKYTNVEILSEQLSIDELAENFGLDTGPSKPL